MSKITEKALIAPDFPVFIIMLSIFSIVENRKLVDRLLFGVVLMSVGGEVFINWKSCKSCEKTVKSLKSVDFVTCSKTIVMIPGNGLYKKVFLEF